MISQLSRNKYGLWSEYAMRTGRCIRLNYSQISDSFGIVSFGLINTRIDGFAVGSIMLRFPIVPICDCIAEYYRLYNQMRVGQHCCTFAGLAFIKHVMVILYVLRIHLVGTCTLITRSVCFIINVCKHAVNNVRNRTSVCGCAISPGT